MSRRRALSTSGIVDNTFAIRKNSRMRPPVIFVSSLKPGILAGRVMISTRYGGLARAAGIPAIVTYNGIRVAKSDLGLQEPRGPSEKSRSEKLPCGVHITLATEWVTCRHPRLRQGKVVLLEEKHIPEISIGRDLVKKARVRRVWLLGK